MREIAGQGHHLGGHAPLADQPDPPLGAVVGFTAHDRRDAARRLSAEVRQALVADGYGACLYRWTTGVAPSCDARDLRWLLKLVELGYEYDGAATLRPGDFVAWVKQRRVPDAGMSPLPSA